MHTDCKQLTLLNLPLLCSEQWSGTRTDHSERAGTVGLWGRTSNCRFRVGTLLY